MLRVWFFLTTELKRALFMKVSQVNVVRLPHSTAAQFADASCRHSLTNSYTRSQTLVMGSQPQRSVGAAVILHVALEKVLFSHVRFVFRSRRWASTHIWHGRGGTVAARVSKRAVVCQVAASG
jgi:hypothetical protein